MTQKTTVVLVDDHPVFLKGLRMLLEDEPDLSVIGEADNGKQAITVITELQPEIVVLDISMPDMGGIEVAAYLSANFPKIKIIALSIHSEKRFVEDMLLAGAAGYILKQTAPEDLVSGIRTVMHGDAFLSPAITSVVLSGFKATRQVEPTNGPESRAIIAAKLIPPPLPDNYVERKELAGKLKNGSRLPVTLITAAAGYGKSSTVSHWLTMQPTPYGWISLDKTDSDLRQFLHYFIHVIQSLFPASLKESEMLLGSANLPSIHTLAVSFLKEIGHIEQSFILVLDDVHMIRQKEFSDFFSELLRHPPPQLHLIIMGRRDPFLPIALLRGRRMLVELRVRDLQFSFEETQEYLQLMLGETGSDRLAHLLHQKMEGWIAGLRLAILSLDQRPGMEETLEQLQKDSHFVQEYLYTEALETLTPALRADVIKMAILDRFCGPLCEALVCGVKNISKTQFVGWDFLKELSQANLFLTRLDGENTWYRFHHEFQQLLLQQQQRSCSSEQIKDLHRAASTWFVSNGFYGEGIKHALAGQDLEGAEKIVQQNRQREIGQDRWHNLEKWLSMFPEEEILKRPVLLLAYGWICYNSYRLQELAALLERFEVIASKAHIDDTQLGEVHILKGVLSYWQGKSGECLQQLGAARDILAQTPPLVLGLMDMYEPLALQMDGNYERVIEQLDAKIRLMGIKPAIFRSRIVASLSFVHLIDGDLKQASAAAERMQIVCAQNKLTHSETWAHYLLGNTNLQLFNLEKAANHFEILKNKLSIMHTRAAIDGLAGLALTRYFQRETHEAFAVSKLLEEFAYQTEEHHLICVAHSLKARLMLLHGDETAAEKYLQPMSRQHADPALFTWLELPETTLIRTWISSGSDEHLNDASELLAPLKQRAEALYNNCHLVEIMVLETLLLLKTEGAGKARAQLGDTITMAARGGWVRPFIEAGRPLIELLLSLKAASDQAKHHITVIKKIVSKQRLEVVEANLASQVLTEPLTSREAEILELLAQRLSNKEIGERLYISTETVKSHVKRLFSKLDAVNRRDVVAKANDLGLILKM